MTIHVLIDIQSAAGANLYIVIFTHMHAIKHAQ